MENGKWKMENDCRISVGEGHFRCGMIAPGNHLFRRFAALCNTLPQRIDNHDAGSTHQPSPTAVIARADRPVAIPRTGRKSMETDISVGASIARPPEIGTISGFPEGK